MVRVYPGPLAPSTVFIPVKIDETSTASDIARKVACQLDLKIQNPSLVEEIPNNQTILDPTDYPLDRYMLWPKQAKSGTVFISVKWIKIFSRKKLWFLYKTDEKLVMLRININLFCRKARKKVLIIPIVIAIASCSSHVVYYPLKIKCHKICAVWQVHQMYPSYEFCVGALKIVKYTVGLGRYSFLWIHTRIYQSTPQFIPISIEIEAWNLKPMHSQLQMQHMVQWKKKMFQLLFRVNLDLENHFQLNTYSWYNY